MNNIIKKTFWSAGVALLAVLWITATFWVFRDTQKAADEHKRTNVTLSQANELLSELKDAETGQRGFVLTGDESFLEPYLSAAKVIDGHVARLQQLTLIEEAHQAAHALEPLIKAKMQEMAEVITVRRTGGLLEGSAAVATSKGRRLMDDIREVMQGLIQLEEAALVKRNDAVQAETRRLFAVLITTSAMTLLFALSVVYIFKRRSAERLKNLVYVETQHLLERQQETNRQLQLANVTLELSEEKIAVLLNSIGDGVIATNAVGRVTLLNPLAERLTGWTQAEAIDRPIGEVLNIIDRVTRQPANLPITAVLAQGTTQGLDDGTLLLSRDGRERPIADSCAPIRDRAGRVVGAVQVFRDDTERQLAEQNLRQALTELKHANLELAQSGRLKDEFLANMSHELRTPLNAILGLSEALLEQTSGPLSARQVRSITTISASGTHLLTLINDILDLSKVEAGRLELNPESLPMLEFCESCLLFVRTQAQQKGISITFAHDRAPTQFTADAKRLKQVLVNLLTNAVKFTPAGGRIGLTVAPAADEGTTRLTVWDTGIGIAPEDRRKLFRAFSQIDSGLTRAQEGTGLGLALVAKLVELHGGSLTLESEPDQGSRFTVTLPQIASAVVSQSAPSAAPDRRRYRNAFVIEDDPTSGAILVNYLTELGIHSVLQEGGEQAVEAVLRMRPDVILLDIIMPGDSGWVVLVRLKEHPGTRDIPVVIISVMDEPARSRALGAAAHFTKPVTRGQLAAFFQRDNVSLAPFEVPSVAPATPHGPVILLAEDNEANVQTMGGYLEEKGYTMIYAVNGVVAVQLARELHPALILMDIQMPVMDGLTAIMEIRASDPAKYLPIVALTALAMPGDRERCLAAGATAYMSKPVQLKALAELIIRLLPEPEGRPPAMVPIEAATAAP
jgi:PAS domain S-box-containing protein